MAQHPNWIALAQHVRSLELELELHPPLELQRHFLGLQLSLKLELPLHSPLEPPLDLAVLS